MLFYCDKNPPKVICDKAGDKRERRPLLSSSLGKSLEGVWSYVFQEYSYIFSRFSSDN